jgi:prepilin-type N-terminal cleavage/methylation domain-containing protein
MTPPPAFRPRGALPGFTLIEMMLAVFVLGLILVMMAGSFHAVAGSKLHGEGNLVANREGRAIVWQLSNDLRDAVQTPAPGNSRVLLSGTAQYAGRVPLNTVVVSTLAAGHRRTLDGFGAEDLVSYSLVANPAHRGWYILQRAQQSALAPSLNEGAVVPIAANVLGLKIQYFDGSNWNEVWNSTNLSFGSQLPAAVSIDLTLAGPGGAPMSFATQVTLPMAFTSAW